MFTFLSSWDLNFIIYRLLTKDECLSIICIYMYCIVFYSNKCDVQKHDKHNTIPVKWAITQQKNVVKNLREWYPGYLLYTSTFPNDLNLWFFFVHQCSLGCSYPMTIFLMWMKEGSPCDDTSACGQGSLQERDRTLDMVTRIDYMGTPLWCCI